MELTPVLVRSIISMAAMVMIGFAGIKSGVLKPEDSRPVSAILLYLISPCVILYAFEVECTADSMHGLLVTTLAALLVHIVFIAGTKLLARPLKMDSIDRSNVIYSNCGNLIIPMVTAMLGHDYVLYATPYLVVMTILLWTHGLKLVAPDADIKIKDLLTNPNIVSIAVGLVFFFTGWRLPGPLNDAVAGVADCVGPIAMFGIGMIMATADWKEVFGHAHGYLVVAMRLIAASAATIAVLAVLLQVFPGSNTREVLLITLLAASAPMPAAMTMLVNLYRDSADATRSSGMNILSMIVGMFTMPMIVGFYLMIF